MNYTVTSVCTELNTLSHMLRINNRARTYTHAAKRDYPCQRFGWGLIWSNGGSESWFVFPSFVRLRSSSPGDTTSRILTPSVTELHTQNHHPAYLTRAHRYTEHHMCESALQNGLSCLLSVIVTNNHKLRAYYFFVFESLPSLHFFFFINVMWTRQAHLVHYNANWQMRKGSFVFSPWEGPLSPFNVTSYYLMSPGTEP